MTVKIENSWLELRKIKAEDCGLFLVNGDSMYPSLKDGEEIIVDLSKQNLLDGKIFILNNNGAVLVKKAYLAFDSVELVSENTFYKPITLNKNEANHLIVIGQVVRSYRNF